MKRSAGTQLLEFDLNAHLTFAPRQHLCDRTEAYRCVSGGLDLRRVGSIESIEELDERFDPEAIPQGEPFREADVHIDKW